MSIKKKFSALTKTQELLAIFVALITILSAGTALLTLIFAPITIAHDVTQLESDVTEIRADVEDLKIVSTKVDTLVREFNAKAEADIIHQIEELEDQIADLESYPLAERSMRQREKLSTLVQRRQRKLLQLSPAALRTLGE